MEGVCIGNYMQDPKCFPGRIRTCPDQVAKDMIYKLNILKDGILGTGDCTSIENIL